MKVLEPKELEQRRDKRTKKQKRKHRKRLLAPALFMLIGLYVAAVLVLPVASLNTTAESLSLPPAGSVSLQWPAYGEAAVGAVGYGLLAQNGDEKPLPTASVAKVITAVAVLKAHPIKPGTEGDTITITESDVEEYEDFRQQGQSVVLVRAGEEITEYEALQALLLPSANNMAHVLARWAFGSTDDYLTFVNPFVKTLGMTNTHIADPSGFDPGTTSTAVDLTKLAEIAMNNPTIAEIVGQKQADIPVAGTVYNYNGLLGRGGMVGIKTGNTDEAGGCFMFAATREVADHQNVTVVGVIMGAPDLESSIKDSLPLLDEAFKNFTVTTPVETGKAVGTISQPGGPSAPITVRQGKQLVSWVGQAPKAEVTIKHTGSHVNAGDDLGTLTVSTGNMTYDLPLTTNTSIPARSLWWRIRHAAGYL